MAVAVTEEQAQDMGDVVEAAVAVGDIGLERKEPEIRSIPNVVGQGSKDRPVDFVVRPGHRSLPGEGFSEGAYAAACRNWWKTWYSCGLRAASYAEAELTTMSWCATCPRADHQKY